MLPVKYVPYHDDDVVRSVDWGMFQCWPVGGAIAGSAWATWVSPITLKKVCQ